MDARISPASNTAGCVRLLVKCAAAVASSVPLPSALGGSRYALLHDREGHTHECAGDQAEAHEGKSDSVHR
jgi:hypothetical protein